MSRTQRVIRNFAFVLAALLTILAGVAVAWGVSRSRAAAQTDHLITVAGRTVSVTGNPTTINLPAKTIRRHGKTIHLPAQTVDLTRLVPQVRTVDGTVSRTYTVRVPVPGPTRTETISRTVTETQTVPTTITGPTQTLTQTTTITETISVSTPPPPPTS